MATLAFVGLGLMGTPMASRLLEAGHDLTVWNRTAERTRPLADRGASVAATPAEAAAGVDAAITMVANPEALTQVVFGPDGLASGLGPGQLLIDMSTVGPDAVRSVAARLPHGVGMVDAPVRGSVPEATAGRLAIYVGADQRYFERVAPILAPLGHLYHVGGPGAGAATKVVVNSTLGAAIAAFGEALALGEVLGLDRPVLLDTSPTPRSAPPSRPSGPTSNPASIRPTSSSAWPSRTSAWSTSSPTRPAAAWRSPRRRGTGWSRRPRPARATSTTRPCSPPSPATGHRPRHDPAFVADVQWRTLSWVWLPDTRSGGVTWPAD
jgi:3-hydroxyisobutyrate dehydrogenase-like beta-hydroxyacid dehydrogenase